MNFLEKIEVAAKAALMARTVPDGESQQGFVLKVRARILDLITEAYPEAEVNIQISNGELHVLADTSQKLTGDAAITSFKITDGGALQFHKTTTGEV